MFSKYLHKQTPGEPKMSNNITIDLRSDTITKPSKAMREAMMNAEVGDDVFGEDPTINRLQEISADLFDFQAGLFVPSGTMANEIAINVHTRPGDEVILDSLCHIINFESGAPGLLSGVNLITISAEKGYLTSDQIKKAIRPDQIQFARTSLICLENTNNYAGGSLFPINEIRKIAEVATKYKIKMHMDGARIFNAITAEKIIPSVYSKYFDSLTFCISKGLGAPVGSVLLGSGDFIERSRKIRKIFGGGMRQAGILAAAGIYALENNVSRLSEDHENAKTLAIALQKTKTFDVDPDAVESNIVIFRLTDLSLTPATATEKLAMHGIKVFPFGANQLRAVTHLDVSKDDINEACLTLQKFF